MAWASKCNIVRTCLYAYVGVFAIPTIRIVLFWTAINLLTAKVYEPHSLNWQTSTPRRIHCRHKKSEFPIDTVLKANIYIDIVV